MIEQSEIPLILFSGLAADASIFVSQKLVFPQLIIPKWIKPERNETLSTYCERLAGVIAPSDGCIIGGASFGGIVALEIAQFVNPRCVVLIGSVRCPSELPRRIRGFKWIRSAVSTVPLKSLQWLAGTGDITRRWLPHMANIARQFRNADPLTVRWSIQQILSWSGQPKVACPVYHIHGDRDYVMPISLTHPDVIVHGGGHVISLTHSGEVNAFLKACMKPAFEDDSISRDSAT